MAAFSDSRARNAPFPPARRRLALLAIAGITCSIGIVALVSLGDAAWMVDSSRKGPYPRLPLAKRAEAGEGEPCGTDGRGTGRINIPGTR